MDSLTFFPSSVRKTPFIAFEHLMICNDPREEGGGAKKSVCNQHRLESAPPSIKVLCDVNGFRLIKLNLIPC